MLDLDTAAGRERLSGLVAGADIVVETGGHGLDWAAIRSLHPALTIISVSGFGRTGPWRDWRAPDLVTWAVSGAMYSTGLPGRPPLHANWAIANQVAGLYAAIGALAGLSHRRETGHGLHFDLSRQEAVVSLLMTHVARYLYGGGELERRHGIAHPNLVPMGVFATLDGRVTFQAFSRGQWSALVEWMVETGEVDDWFRDPALEPSLARREHGPRIHQWLEPRFRALTTADLFGEANRRRIPCAPINAPRDVLRDEQLRARGFFVPVDQPGLGRPVETPGLPFHSDLGGSVRPAPRWVQGTGDRVPGLADGVRWLPRLDDPAPAVTRHPVPGTPDPVPSIPLPLAGVRILDLTWVLAGPTGVRALADLGADVIKVEPRVGGDATRSNAPFVDGVVDPNRSASFMRICRNRRSLGLDLKKPAAIEIVRRLAAWADLVIDNFGAGVMSRLGLGPEDLAAVKPDLIPVSLSGYGQTGPHAGFTSYAAVTEARSGLSFATAYPDGTAVGPGIFIGDTGPGLQVAVYALAALERRRRTGQGTYLDMSQLEAASWLLGPALLEAAVSPDADSLAAIGNRLPDRAAAPHGAYPTAGEDRWIAIAVLDDATWRALIKVMGRPELATDPRFATAEDRAARVDLLDALIGAWTKDQEGRGLAERLQAAGVPAGPVQTARDLLECDPQIAGRGFFQYLSQPEAGPVVVDSSPLRWTDEPVPIRRPAPLLGEHNEEILREILGLSEAEIVELVIDEVL